MADEALDFAKDADTKEPALGGMLIRDGAALVGLLALWGGAEAWAAGTSLPLAVFTAVGASLVAGWTIAGLFHEWGHYAGAKLARASAPRVKLPGLSFFRYNFDLEKNSVPQFTAMGIGGNLAHWGGRRRRAAAGADDHPGASHLRQCNRCVRRLRQRHRVADHRAHHKRPRAPGRSVRPSRSGLSPSPLCDRGYRRIAVPGFLRSRTLRRAMQPMR